MGNIGNRRETLDGQHCRRLDSEGNKRIQNEAFTPSGLDSSDGTLPVCDFLLFANFMSVRDIGFDSGFFTTNLTNPTKKNQAEFKDF